MVLGSQSCSLEKCVFSFVPGTSPLEKGIIEGDNPVHGLESFWDIWHTFEESSCLGMQL